MFGKREKTDLAEFVNLLIEHQSVMRQYISQLIPNADDISDVVQNTNLMLWERRGDFTPGTNFQAWALATARLRAFEHRNRMKRDHRLVFEEKLFEVLDQEFEERPYLTEEKKIALETCLGKLKPKDRTLIDIRYSESTTLSEHALADGRSEKSLRVILNRLRSALKECIDRQLKRLDCQTT